MLICDPRKIVSNVDRMAYEHLLSVGIIHPNKAGRPRGEKKIPQKRVGWKKLGPMRDGSCGQCGDEGTVEAQTRLWKAPDAGSRRTQEALRTVLCGAGQVSGSLGA